MTTDRPVLRGATLVLRQPRKQDAAARLSLGRDAGIMRMFGMDAVGWPPFTILDTARGVDNLTAHPYAWVVDHGGHLLGEVRLDGLDPHDARARLAIGLYDPAKLGMGLGRQAIRLVLAHAFGPLGLHRVRLRVLAYNVRAIRCYGACGFVVEGREREAARVGGEWHDDIMMGMLARELAGSSLSDETSADRNRPV